MKKYICLLLILWLSIFVQAQSNLVPNPSFEDTIGNGCPQGYPNLDGKCKNWMSFKGSPDYMHNCSSACGYNNQFGFQIPHSGEAYTGFATYQVTNSGTREHISVQLTSPLVIGTKYYLSFYISSAWNNLLTNIATSKTGALLTTYSYYDPNCTAPLANTCTIYNNNVIKDTTNWVKISGSFVSDSTYTYLSIGNFFEDSYIDTLNFPYQVVPQAAYYYLDDVCVSTDSLYAQTWTSINEILKPVDLTVFPNPTTDYLIIKATANLHSLKIYDTFGRLVIYEEIDNKREISLDTRRLAKGIYFIKVNDQDGYSKKIIIH